jgi:hypothetical protein
MSIGPVKGVPIALKRIFSAAIRSTMYSLVVLGLLGSLVVFVLPVKAQSPELQQRLADLKQAMAQNKQKLGQYTWMEQVTIFLKGEQKKQESFLVRLGPDGKPQKTPVNEAASSGGGGGGRLKQRVVEKKKEEFKDYADRMKSLMERYVPPDKDLLQQAQEKGNIALAPGAGAPSQVQLVIHDYVKPNDSMTLVFDKDQKQLLSLQVASYLDDPKDAVNLTVKMSRLPDGVSHMDSTVLEGVSKQLKLAIQNSNYQQL